MKNKVISDKWDVIDRAIDALHPVTQSKEESKDKNQPEHPFSRFCSKDECVTIITDKNGKVMKLVKDRPYPVYENILQIDDYFVYTFSCRKNHLLTRLPSVPNGVAINNAFFEKFSDNDKFIVEIIPSRGNNVLERYAIDKATVLKEGKIKQFPGYEKQIVVSLVHWKKIN